MSNEDLQRLLGGKHLPSWINFPDYQRVEWVNDVIGDITIQCHSMPVVTAIMLN